MQQKKILNEYDSTKKMLYTLRKLNGLIVENELGAEQPNAQQADANQVEDQQNQDPLGPEDAAATAEQKNDFVVINDVEVKLLSSDSADMQLTDEQKTSISNLGGNTNFLFLKSIFSLNTIDVILSGNFKIFASK